MKVKVALLSVMILLTSACSGGGNSSSSSSPGPLTGNWQMSLKKTNSSLVRTESGFLTQTGSSVTGSLALFDIPCSEVGNVAGTVSGTSVALIVSPSGITVNLMGTLGANQNTMSGSYNILTSGCGTTETGTWTANLVTPLSGNFTGTFTSQHSGALQVNGQLTQAANTGASTASLTGNATISGYCVGATNINGTIGGTQVVLNLLSAGGAELIQVTGTSSLDGTTITGTFKTIGQGPGATAPCIDGDGGTVSLTLGSGGS